MDRREFLRGTLGASVLAAAPAAASAAPLRGRSAEEDAIGVQLADLRAAQAAREAHIVGALRQQIGATTGPPAAELDEVLVLLARGMGAAATLGEADRLPVRTQAHPWTQALLLELGERVGAALLAVQEVLTPVAEGLAVPQAALLSALEALEALTADVMPRGQRALGRRSVRRLREHVAPEALQALAQQGVRRIRALQHLAVRAAAQGHSRHLRRADPALEAEVQAAQAHWAEAAADGRGARVGLVVLGILGLIATGALISSGVVVLALGAVSLVACICAGVILLAAGAMILAAGAIVGIVSVALLLGVSVETIQHRIRRNREAETIRGVSLTAEAGWVSADVLLQRGLRYGVEVQGQTQDPVHDLAPLGPGGDPGRPGGDGWRLPGAPEGALLGRIRSQVFLIGAARVLPDGLSGTLFLAINVAEDQAAARQGRLQVWLAPTG